MRSISDIHRELGCGRNTIYPVIEAAGVEPTLEGLAKMFTDEDFQKIQEVYYRKYPNRKPKELTKEISTLFKIDSDNQNVEVVHSKERFIPVQDILEEERKIFARTHQRDAEHIEDLRQERDHYKELLKIMNEKNSELHERNSELQNLLLGDRLKPQSPAISQRTPVKFPEYDPNVDTLTKPMFSESDFKQPPEDTQKPGEAIYLPNLTGSKQPEKTGSWQLEAFSEDGPPLSPDEAVTRYFKGRFPQRTPDMPDLLRYLENSGFPHTRDAASTRLAKLRRKQRAARESGAL